MVNSPLNRASVAFRTSGSSKVLPVTTNSVIGTLMVCAWLDEAKQNNIQQTSLTEMLFAIVTCIPTEG
jgi:hypothetical protein